jgi:hypothetical protein
MSPEQSTAVATAVHADAPANVAVQQEVRTPPTCTNCEASVPGNYCGRCGQRLEHEIHSIWHFTREATEDLTHADSRLWRTIIALLFKPGFLTREFLGGKRVRYLPPLRLYLVLSVLFFLVLSSGHHDTKDLQLKVGEGAPSAAVVPPDKVEGFTGKPGETTQQHEQRVCNPEYDGPARSFVLPFLQKGCRKVAEDRGRTVSEAFMHTLPRAMFIFLPALALVMMAMYWRPRRYYVEHLLFFVHNHAFAFLVLALLTSITRFVPSAIGNGLTVIVWLYIPYYLFVSMRRVYGQGRFRTFAKLVVLSFTYFIGAAITLALTGMYSVYAA